MNGAASATFCSFFFCSLVQAFTLLNMVAPLSHLVSAFAFMIEFGIIQCQYVRAGNMPARL